MNICNENEDVKDTYKHPELIGGHLYEIVNCFGDNSGIYIYSGFNNLLISLEDGNRWSYEGFGDTASKAKDVTDQYCLKKVK